MLVQISELKALAKDVEIQRRQKSTCDKKSCSCDILPKARYKFQQAATPELILELIDKLEETNESLSGRQKEVKSLKRRILQLSKQK